MFFANPRLTDEHGVQIPLTQTLFSEYDDRSGHVILRPERLLSPNTLYTVELKVSSSGNVPTGGANFNSPPDVELREDGSSYYASWSFQTGEGERAGIDGQTLTVGPWGWVTGYEHRRDSCDPPNARGSVFTRAYTNALHVPDGVPVLYRFETQTEDGAVETSMNGNIYRDRGHVIASSVQDRRGMCGQWVANDAYGHEVRSEVVCTPDVCTDWTHLDPSAYPSLDEETFVSLGNDLCTGEPSPDPNTPPEDDPTPQKATPTKTENNSGGCSTTHSPHTPTKPLAVLILVGCFTWIRRRTYIHL